jgi:hypothetical protein
MKREDDNVKAIPWKQEDDWDCKDKTLGCEGCYNVIHEGYLIGFDSDNEAAKARKIWGAFKPSKDSKAVCCHPDNWLICEDCLNERFIFKRKSKKPFEVSLVNR